MDILNKKIYRNKRGELGKNTRKQEVGNRDDWGVFCNSQPTYLETT